MFLMNAQEEKIIQMLVDEFGSMLIDVQSACGKEEFEVIIQNTCDQLKPFKYDTDEELKTKVIEVFGNEHMDPAEFKKMRLDMNDLK